MAKRDALFFTAVLFLVASIGVVAELNTLTINSDSRPLIFLGQFGFSNTGHVNISVDRVATAAGIDPSLLGFLLVPETDGQKAQNEPQCVLDSKYVHCVLRLLDYSPASHSCQVRFPNTYKLFFANCAPPPYTSVNMTAHAELYNLDRDGSRNYLSYGLSYLPAIFFVFAIAYITLLGSWIVVCLSNKIYVHRIHLLIAGILLVKALSLVFAAEDWHDQKATGMAHTWHVRFYIFRCVHDVLFFVAVILISSRWSFLKPSLHVDESAKLIGIILFQAVASVAQIGLDEKGPRINGGNLYTYHDVKFFMLCLAVFLISELICMGTISSNNPLAKADWNTVKYWFLEEIHVVAMLCLILKICIVPVWAVIPYEYRLGLYPAGEIFSFAFYVLIFATFLLAKSREHLYFDNYDDEEECLLV